VPTCAQITGVGLVADGYILMHLTLSTVSEMKPASIFLCAQEEEVVCWWNAWN